MCHGISGYIAWLPIIDIMFCTGSFSLLEGFVPHEAGQNLFGILTPLPGILAGSRVFFSQSRFDKEQCWVRFVGREKHMKIYHRKRCTRIFHILVRIGIQGKGWLGSKHGVKWALSILVWIFFALGGAIFSLKGPRSMSDSPMLSPLRSQWHPHAWLGAFQTQGDVFRPKMVPGLGLRVRHFGIYCACFGLWIWATLKKELTKLAELYS